MQLHSSTPFPPPPPPLILLLLLGLLLTAFTLAPSHPAPLPSAPLPRSLSPHKVDDKSKTFTLGGKTFKSGDWISLNGNTGEVLGLGLRGYGSGVKV